MSYVLLDDQFHSHPKIEDVGNAGAGLFARALSYCGSYLTDGFVPEAWVKARASEKLRQKLCDAGLWTRVVDGESFHYDDGSEHYIVTVEGNGFFIPDYLVLNPSRKQVEARREAKSEAGKRGAEKRWRGGKRVTAPIAGAIAGAMAPATDVPMAEGMANVWQSDGSRARFSPAPSPEKPRTVTATVNYDSPAGNGAGAGTDEETEKVRQTIDASLASLDDDEPF